MSQDPQKERKRSRKKSKINGDDDPEKVDSDETRKLSKKSKSKKKSKDSVEDESVILERKKSKSRKRSEKKASSPEVEEPEATKSDAPQSNKEIGANTRKDSDGFDEKSISFSEHIKSRGSNDFIRPNQEGSLNSIFSADSLTQEDSYSNFPKLSITQGPDVYGGIPIEEEEEGGNSPSNQLEKDDSGSLISEPTSSIVEDEKESFRSYLENSGVLDALLKILVLIYENPTPGTTTSSTDEAKEENNSREQTPLLNPAMSTPKQFFLDELTKMLPLTEEFHQTATELFEIQKKNAELEKENAILENELKQIETKKLKQEFYKEMQSCADED